MKYKLTYWRKPPGEDMVYWEECVIEADNHDKARRKAGEIYGAHDEGTLLDDLCLLLDPPHQGWPSIKLDKQVAKLLFHPSDFILSANPNVGG